MINMLTQFPDLKKYDLTSLRHLGYGGSPMAPELVHRTRQVLPNVKLIQVYGLSETGFLTGLLDHEHTEDKHLLRTALHGNRRACCRSSRKGS
jgi:acyl-coenzyme A synthetase/AMP-(fatty) acid ligase